MNAPQQLHETGQSLWLDNITRGLLDSGTLEHVFHLPNALKSVVELAKVGGRVMLLSPSSNHFDHGFYMFSPTLFYDYFSANGLRIETSYGLGQFGPVSAGGSVSARDLLIMPDLRKAVRRTLEAAEAKALELLTANRPSLDALADALFQSGYLDRAEIDSVLAATPLRPRNPDAGPSPSPAAVPQAGRPKHVDDDGPRRNQPPGTGDAP